MDINLIPDQSVSTAPTGFIQAIEAAADILDQTITNNTIVNITYGWGTFDNMPDPELTGAVLAVGGPDNGADWNYSKLKSELVASATSGDDREAVQSLPANNSVFPNQQNSFYVSSAEEKAFGAFAGDPAAVDGSIGFGTGWTDPNAWMGVALHEITHAMGRINGDSVLDLYRYSAPATFQWTGGDPAYFSIDGGKTDLANFSTRSDFGDWAGDSLTPNDPFNAFFNDNSNALSPVDLTELDVLGFTVAPNEPLSASVSVAVRDPWTLVAKTSSNDTNASVSLQWWRFNPVTHAGTPIPGATGSTYTTKWADRGQQIVAEATASDPERGAAVADSPYVTVLARGANMPLGVSWNRIVGGDGPHKIWDVRYRNRVDLGNGHNQVWLSGSHNRVSLGYGPGRVLVGGNNNKVTVKSGHKIIRAEAAGGSDKFVLDGSNGTVALAGTGNMVFVRGGTDTITDTSSKDDRLTLRIGQAGGTITIADFSVANGKVDLSASLAAELGWSNPSQVAAALTSDHHHGSLLSFGSHGSIDFVKVTHLTAGNFQIG